MNFYIVTILFTRNVVVDIDCYNFFNSQMFGPKLWLQSSLTYYGSYCICFEISTFSSKSFSLIKFDLSFEIYAFGLATSHIGVLKKQTIFFEGFLPLTQKWVKSNLSLDRQTKEQIRIQMGGATKTTHVFCCSFWFNQDLDVLSN